MGEGTFTTGVGVFERPPLGYSVVDRVEKAKVGAELGPQLGLGLGLAKLEN